MVWFSLSWSLKDVLQFNARLHRQGQTKPVFIHYLSVPGSLDEYVFATVKRKGKLQDTLMERLL